MSAHTSVTAHESSAEPFEPFEVHFFGPLTVPVDRSTHHTMGYGSVLMVTREAYEASRDRNGQSYLDPDFLDDEDAQLRRWGRVMMRRGPWPEGTPRLQRGSQEWWDAADAERRAAHKIEDEALKARTLAEIRAKYGSQATSQTIATCDTEKRDPEAWR